MDVPQPALLLLTKNLGSLGKQSRNARNKVTSEAPRDTLGASALNSRQCLRRSSQLGQLRHGPKPRRLGYRDGNTALAARKVPPALQSLAKEGSVDEVASAVALLVCDAASFVAGVALHFGGGIFLGLNDGDPA